MRDTINSQAKALFKWIAGFFEEGTPQSSTRACMYGLLISAVHYAYRVPAPDIEVLGALLSAGLACGGIKLAKDIKAINANVAKTVAGDQG